MLNSTAESGGKRPFAEVLKSSAVSLLTSSVSGNSIVCTDGRENNWVACVLVLHMGMGKSQVFH